LKLILFLNNSEVKSLTLKEGQEYTVGRGEDTDIRLEPEKGISRKHLKIYFNESHWVVECLSQYGGLLVNEEPVKEIVIDTRIEFKVPPYSFIADNSDEINEQEAKKEIASAEIAVDEGASSEDYSDVSESEDYSDANESDNSEPNESEGQEGQAYSPEASVSEQAPQFICVDEEAPEEKEEVPQANASDFEGDLESTMIGVSTLEILLTAEHPNGEKETFKLEGYSWIVGRDASCEIHLQNNHISRRHLEITYSNEILNIIDLGSSNGTHINNEKISPKIPYRVDSGDLIRIKNIIITIIVKDANYNNRINAIAEEHLLVPQIKLQPVQGQPSNLPAVSQGAPQNLVAQPADVNPMAQYLGLDLNQEAVELVKNEPIKKKKNNKIVIYAVIGLVPFLLMGLFSDDKPKKDKRQPSSTSKNSNPFEQLKPQEKDLVKDAFRLAKSYLHSAKFGLCLSELEKIHFLIPSYRRSKNIERTCREGLRIKDIRRTEQERQEKQRQTKMKVLRIIKLCTAKFNQFKSLDELNFCLSEASDLDPGSAEIEALQMRLQAIIDRKARGLNVIKNRRRLIAIGEQKYQKAMNAQDPNETLKSIKALEQFLSTNYPDPKGNKSKAKALIIRLRNLLKRKVSTYLNSCNSKLQASDYKSAFYLCQKALKEDPNNQDAKELISRIQRNLSTKMKELYDNASIEENYGNIESAKEIWTKIITDDFKGGTVFFERAERQLRKYGD